MDKTILHWSYLNFKEIPMDLYLYENLQEVYLKENFITVIPKWLLNLTTLRFINLAGNNLTSLPEEMYLLHGLEFLDVSNNQITELPTTIGLILRLQNLNVSGNLLKEIPAEIGTLRYLEDLNISKNQLRRLPLELSQCVRLLILNFGDNENIWHVPERISNMPSLQQLLADRCNLVYLPVAIPKFLAFVRIFHNTAITHIPVIYERFYGSFYEARPIKTPMIVTHPNFFWILEHDTNTKLLLPFGTRNVFKVPSAENQVTLYDECLHSLELNIRYKSLYDESLLQRMLPEKYMIDHIINGPIARCTNFSCSRSLYTTYYFMVVKRCGSTSKQLFTCYFCTQYCGKFWLYEKYKKYYQVGWEIYDEKTSAQPHKESPKKE